jgi:hypothetical protein
VGSGDIPHALKGGDERMLLAMIRDPRRDLRRMTPAVSGRRAKRELKTVGAMIALYCRGKHGTELGLCADCAEIWGYARQRVADCPLLADKPTCVSCTVHCYKLDRREQIKTVMRYSGPRMVWRHPILAVRHWIDGQHDRLRASIVDRSAPRARIRKS